MAYSFKLLNLLFDTEQIGLELYSKGTVDIILHAVIYHSDQRKMALYAIYLLDSFSNIEIVLENL